MFRWLIKSLLLISFVSEINAMNLELTQGINVAMPLAIQSFNDYSKGAEITKIIENDLNFTGQFNILPIAKNKALPTELIAISRQKGADSVLSGNVVQLNPTLYEVNFELRDVTTGGRLLQSKNYKVAPEGLRNLAHHISDEIYYQLTGEKGVFKTRIAYVLVKKIGKKSRYSLEISDMDGHGPHSLIVSSDPIMSPTWSPDGQQIAYVSFEKKRSQIFTVSVETGKRMLITSFPGINGAPAWSPNGRELTVVLSKNGSPKLYKIDLLNGSMQQLTYGESIDTEPSYAPDGKSLLFTSNRGGTPQIYKYDFANQKISRITYTGNYNARASYTPNNKQIVMLHRDDNSFNIGVQNISSGEIIPITFSETDESPSIAPNGRMVIYAAKNNYKPTLKIVSLDGKAQRQLPILDGEVQSPSWSPFLG